MEIAFNKTFAVFRTPFSDTEDLVQAFSGIRSGGINDPDPVDCFYAALVRKACPDIWHADTVLALSTDEAPPQVIAGADLGGNHAPECAVAAESREVRLSARDIGTLWRDEAGLEWTCLTVHPEGGGLFLSENLGPNETDFSFAEAIAGSLSRADGARFPISRQIPRTSMASCIRHLERTVSALRGGEWQRVRSDVRGCDQARIHEVYEIVNPVSAARTLREGRPPEGYSGEQSLALGEALFRVEKNLSIHDNGAIVTDFTYQTLQPIRWQGCLGLMYQEKCRPKRGRVLRMIPGLKPFSDAGIKYDFSRPRDVSAPFPACFPAGPETWRDPRFPPDRLLEQICFDRSRQCVAFTAGILPVDDGAPEIRRENLEDALCLVSSRKAYLTFCGSASPAICAQRERTFTRLKGTVYRLYFPADRGACFFVIPHRDALWLYADWIRTGKKEVTSFRYSLPAGFRASLQQSGGDAAGAPEGGTLRLWGSRGWALWRIAPQSRDEPRVQDERKEPKAGGMN